MIDFMNAIFRTLRTRLTSLFEVLKEMSFFVEEFRLHHKFDGDTCPKCGNAICECHGCLTCGFNPKPTTAPLTPQLQEGPAPTPLGQEKR